MPSAWMLSFEIPLSARERYEIGSMVMRLRGRWYSTSSTDGHINGKHVPFRVVYDLSTQRKEQEEVTKAHNILQLRQEMWLPLVHFGARLHWLSAKLDVVCNSLHHSLQCPHFLTFFCARFVVSLHITFLPTLPCPLCRQFEWNERAT